MLALLAIPILLGCQTLSRFDTKGKSAYCGQIVDSPFVRTPTDANGFDRRLGLRLTIDTSELTTTPGTITSNDAVGGPCAGVPTFDGAKLLVTSELANDPLSTFTFEDGQVHNIVAWVDSTCRGTMMAVVSLYKSNHVEVRLLKPVTDPANTKDHGAFALFMLDRNDSGCESQ
ncbi:MAG TPA: hypothetical protein VH062_31140 [Polyangiaceae bacterium]|nr:hypothetical protein [Polyangiaceae bacterium]